MVSVLIYPFHTRRSYIAGAGHSNCEGIYRIRNKEAIEVATYI